MAEKMCSRCTQDKAIPGYNFCTCLKCYFEQRNFVLLDENYDLKYYCQTHPDIILTLSYGDLHQIIRIPSCPTCNRLEGASKRFDKIRSTSSVTLPRHLRNLGSPWRNDSVIKDNLYCYITGARIYLDVHHPIAFNDLYNILKLQMGLNRSSREYELREFDAKTRERIRSLWNDILYKHGLGITLARSIHKFFHHIYGIKNLLPENLVEFKKNLFNGGYSVDAYVNRDKWLSEGIPANLIDTFSRGMY